jgi:Tat protein secretion system quality control protein TatD with DNase activity
LNIKDKASRLRQLQKDPVFQEVIKEIREAQVTVFLNSGSQMEDLKAAHEIVRALDQFDIYFNTVYAEEKMYDKRK